MWFKVAQDAKIRLSFFSSSFSCIQTLLFQTFLYHESVGCLIVCLIFMTNK